LVNSFTGQSKFYVLSFLETVNIRLSGSSTRCQVNSISDSKPTIYDGNTSNTIKLFHNFD